MGKRWIITVIASTILLLLAACGANETTSAIVSPLATEPPDEPIHVFTPVPEVDGEIAPQIGSVAPDFELPVADGSIIRLSDYRGKPIVVNIMHTW